MEMWEFKIDKEWESEPDELRFEHKGLKCLVLRVESLGHLCGYVGVNQLPEDFDEYEIDVHGGVTFNQETEHCIGAIQEYFQDCKRVIGFDAAHYQDLSPTMPFLGGEYRNMNYMREETIRLAEQLL